jgi:hypothetical protein
VTSSGGSARGDVKSSAGVDATNYRYDSRWKGDLVRHPQAKGERRAALRSGALDPQVTAELDREALRDRQTQPKPLAARLATSLRLEQFLKHASLLFLGKTQTLIGDRHHDAIAPVTRGHADGRSGWGEDGGVR